MTDLVDRYLAVWHVTDADARRTAITEIWSEDARVCTADNDYTGRAAIEARVTSHTTSG